MSRSDRPNIIFVLADDLSYRDLGCFGQLQIQTPTLDRLCAEGMRFDNAYAGSPECGPSRGSLMTGMHMGHCRIRSNDSARGQDHLQPADVTIAELLRAAGYRTGMVGKWGIGRPGTPGTPDKKGFDYSFGFYDQARAHTYYPHYLEENGRSFPLPENFGFGMEHTYRHTHDEVAYPHHYDADGKLLVHGVPDPRAATNSEVLCHQKALDFIDASKDQPFFLYYSTQLPHGPVITPELGEYRHRAWPQRNQEWAAMVTHLDRNVAALLARLEQHGIREDTLLILASDNGYAHWGYMGRRRWQDDPIFRNKGPWYGGKFSAYEGGVRIPLFANWPGRVPAGTSTDQVVALYDLLATCAELAGATAPPTDGISFVPTLLGRPAEQEQHAYLYWENGTDKPRAQAVKWQQYFAFREQPEAPLQLWDNRADVASDYDLAAALPEVVARLEAIMREAHVDSEWYRNPHEDDACFAAKRERAAREGCLQLSTRANATYLAGTGPADARHVAVDPGIPD